MCVCVTVCDGVCGLNCLLVRRFGAGTGGRVGRRIGGDGTVRVVGFRLERVVVVVVVWVWVEGCRLVEYLGVGGKGERGEEL